MLLLESANSLLHQSNSQLMSIKLLFKPLRVYLLSNWRKRSRRSWSKNLESKKSSFKSSFKSSSIISQLVVLYSEELREMRLKTKAQSQFLEIVPTALSIELIVFLILGPYDG